MKRMVLFLVIITLLMPSFGLAEGETLESFDIQPYEEQAKFWFTALDAPEDMVVAEVLRRDEPFRYEPYTLDEQGKMIFSAPRVAVYFGGSAEVDGHLRRYWACFDKETMEPIMVEWCYDHDDWDEAKAATPNEMYDYYIDHPQTAEAEALLQAAVTAAAALTDEQLTFAAVGTDNWGGWKCINMRAQLSNGLYVDVALDPADAVVHAISLRRYPPWPEQ